MSGAAAFNPSLMERFRGEVRIARQISHRNVCRVYDLGDIHGAAGGRRLLKADLLDA